MSEVFNCPHAGPCPGCPLIDKPYVEQLHIKRGFVQQELGRYAALSNIEALATVAAQPRTGFRLRAKVAVDETASIGLYARGSHEVVDIPNCRVLSPAVASVFDAARASLPLGIPVRAFDARETNEGVLLTIIVDEGTPPAAVTSSAERLKRALPDVSGIAVSYRKPSSPQLLGGAALPVLGKKVARHRFGEEGPWFLAAPGAFSQVHSGQAAAVYGAVEAALMQSSASLEGRRILELYAGSGALALRLAAKGASVTGVETYAPAVGRALEAAREQNLKLGMVAADAEAELAKLIADRQRFDAVVVNPPRAGLTTRVRAHMAALEPAQVIYVSCNPRTLARDLDVLAREGLRVQRVTPFDMIPLSDSVEAIAILHRGAAPPPKVLYEDEQLIAVIKSPHEPTTPQGEHARSLLERVRKLPNASFAVPVHRLDIGTSGVCLFARRPEHVAELSKALEQGQKEYTTLVRGIARAKGAIRRPLPDGRKLRPALTRYQRQRVIAGHSLVIARPEQGRTHQIRRHFNGIGHPILGDARYGDPRSNLHFERRYGLDRSFLHCSRITLGGSRTSCTLSAPLAADLEAVLASLSEREPAAATF